MAILSGAGDVPEVAIPITPPAVGDGAGAVTSRTFAVGESSGVAAKLSENAARLDVMALYSGPPRIAAGLEITAVALEGTVAAGVAISQGVLSLEADATDIIILDDDTTFLWLRQLAPGSAPEVVASATSPSDGAVYLGAVVTVAGVSTIDTSGVIYARGGGAFRETADVGVPGDTPGNYVLFTKTGSGLWVWDGENYHKCVPAGGATATVVLAKITGGGVDGSLTIEDGIITAAVAPT